MSTTEAKQQTLTPQEIPFTQPQLMSRYITDTGKILPRKYTHLSAKEQRNVTSKIKSACLVHNFSRSICSGFFVARFHACENLLPHSS